MGDGADDAERRALAEREEVIEAEFSEVGAQEMVVREPQGAAALNLFGTDDPAAVIEKAAAVSTALADVINQRGLFKVINAKKYVYVEGWQLLGTILGVFPVMESCEPIEENGVRGYKAVVAAQTRDGAIVGRASALCMRSESKWRSADEYAVSSMAQTRAISKCLRAPLGFIMQLAGFQATPEAEVPEGGFNDRPAPAPAPAGGLAVDLLGRLEQGLEQLKGTKGWALDEVLATASQTYGRPLAKLSDLTAKEALQIIEAMEKFGGVKV